MLTPIARHIVVIVISVNPISLFSSQRARSEKGIEAISPSQTSFSAFLPNSFILLSLLPTLKYRKCNLQFLCLLLILVVCLDCLKPQGSCEERSCNALFLGASKKCSKLIQYSLPIRHLQTHQLLIRAFALEEFFVRALISSSRAKSSVKNLKEFGLGVEVGMIESVSVQAEFF